MPICERDPWRFQFFEDVVCPDEVRVPTDDIDCFEWCDEHRWVYRKSRVARSQGLPAGGPEDMPADFPVFAKPDINLRGMGLGSGIIADAATFRARMTPGMMWMPLLTGDHYSTDAAIENGKCKWLSHAHGETWIDGMFKHWTVNRPPPDGLGEYLALWIDRHMAGYTGMMNFETIGGRIIEAHLRFADQWCDLYGRDWMDALVGLYADGAWRLAQPSARMGYSVPLFARHGQVPQHPPPEAQRRIRAMPDVASLQITYHPAKPGADHPMPPGGFRLGIINCWDLESGFAAREALAACFPDCEIMIPG